MVARKIKYAVFSLVGIIVGVLVCLFSCTLIPTPENTTLDITTLDSTTLDSTTLDSTTLDSTTLDSTTFEDSLLAELNLLRENPGLYADTYIKPMISKFVPSVFEGSTTTYVGIVVYPSGKLIRTVEDASAIRECITELHRSSATSSLSLEDGLSLGAMDLVRDQGETGNKGHTGIDGSQVDDRVSRYGKWHGRVGECICYGLRSPRDIIISLLIDDGVPLRGHRGALISSDYYVSGVASGSHPASRTMCVITFASGYE